MGLRSRHTSMISVRKPGGEDVARDENLDQLQWWRRRVGEGERGTKIVGEGTTKQC